MRPLIAITSCHKYRDRADAQRETWLKDLPADSADVKFFLGQGGAAQRDDEVILDVDDGYYGLVAKVQAICKWALEQGYEHMFKTDDDVYVQPGRLLSSGYEAYDYAGRLRGPSGGYPAPYASGLGYWLNRNAMRVLAEAPLDNHQAEDRWVGNQLCKAGILCRADYRYVVIRSKRNAISAQNGPREGNDIIAACEFTPEEMHKIHKEWQTLKAVPQHWPKASGPLANVVILIKTFLRDGYLLRCIDGIQKMLPECRIIVVDDGYETRQKITAYAKLRYRGHTCLWMPFDSGFGAKANFAIPYFDRQYVLIGSDDFDFNKQEVRDGLIKMATVLDIDKSIDLVSGRVNNVPYESLLTFEGTTCKATNGYHEEREVAGVTYKTCDLTVNYSLIRSRIFRSEARPEGVCWDGGEVKIGGGEHGAFFIDLLRAGHGVAYVPGVTIFEQPQMRSLCHINYPAMRARARQKGRICLRKRGIEKFILTDGTEEIC